MDVPLASDILFADGLDAEKQMTGVIAAAGFKAALIRLISQGRRWAGGMASTKSKNPLCLSISQTKVLGHFILMSAGGRLVVF